jgi:hypothetical protein
LGGLRIKAGRIDGDVAQALFNCAQIETAVVHELAAGVLKNMTPIFRQIGETGLQANSVRDAPQPNLSAIS